MSRHIPNSLEALVRERAQGLCEFCRLPQSSQEATFHTDHIQPYTAGGPTVAENLALACVTCSLRKAARTKARDPRSGQMVPLFHPRRDRWIDHFRWTRGWRVVGQGHRIKMLTKQEPFEKTGVPGGFFSLLPQTGLRSVALQERRDEAAQETHVLGGMTFADAAAVFTKHYVHDPM